MVLIVFNRPRHTALVYERIRAARPKRLFIVADGPRPSHPGDEQLCQATRKIVCSPDWPCEVLTNFSKENLGCRRRIPSGIDWVFEHCTEAIILEDDCVPSASFFGFCSSLLDRYRDDTRIMSIGGANFQLGNRRGSASYYFAGYTHIWGWATWKRAWRHIDVDLDSWSKAREEEWLSLVLTDTLERQYWTDMLEKVYRREIDCWGYQWLYSCWMQGGLTVVPNINLVTNIGVGSDATHTKGEAKALGIPTSEIGECIHPRAVIRNIAADRFHWEEHILADIEREKKSRHWLSRLRKKLAVKTRIQAALGFRSAERTN